MPRFLALLLVAATLAACTPPETYPLSGEECRPGDPVLDLEPIDCIPVP